MGNLEHLAEMHDNWINEGGKEPDPYEFGVDLAQRWFTQLEVQVDLTIDPEAKADVVGFLARLYDLVYQNQSTAPLSEEERKQTESYLDFVGLDALLKEKIIQEAIPKILETAEKEFATMNPHGLVS